MKQGLIRRSETPEHFCRVAARLMPDAKTASVLALVAAGGGGIEGSVTTQAFTLRQDAPMGL
jgi:hypothetical protein